MLKDGQSKKEKVSHGKENLSPLEKSKAPNCPKKLRQWSNESMLGAMKAVMDRRLGVNRDALKFGVPCTTLKDRISGRVVYGIKCST